jgi:lysophospholipase L1-like esterase
MGFLPVAAVPQLAQYPDQRPAQDYAVQSAATGMTELYAAVANRNAARVDIPVIGDSITEGQGATAFSSRWATQANRAVRAAYPTTANGAAGGLGFIPAAATGETSFTWPLTLASGAPGGFLLGPVRNAAQMTAASSYTFVAPAGSSSIRILYFDAPVAGTFSWKVNAGAATNISNTSTSTDLLSASIPLTVGQTLTIAWVSGTVFVEGITHYAADESSGITLHGCGHFGWCSGTESDGWNQANESGFPWAPVLASCFPNLAAVGIMLGVNDANPANGNRTAAQYQADMQGLISTIRGAATALATIPLLLITEYQPGITVTDPAGWPAYAAALRTVAAADGNSRVTDLSYRMPANNGSAPYWADTFHPTNLGHAIIGEIAAAGLRIT